MENENIYNERKMFVEAFKRQSYIMFDALGISVSTSDLPTAPIYKLCRDLYSGSSNFGFFGKLSRLWCRKLRPVVMPKRHALIDRAYKEIITLQQQALITRIIEQAEEKGLHNYE